MKCVLLLAALCWSVLLRAQQPFTRDVWLGEANVPVRVSDMSFGADGFLWLATDAGLARFNGRSVTFQGPREPLTAVCTQQHRLYTGDRDGRVYSHEGRQRRLLLRAGAVITSIRTTTYGLIVCTGGEGVYLVRNGQRLHFDSRRGLPDDYVYGTEVWGRSVVLATDRGVSYIAPWIRRADGKLDVYLTQRGDIARVVTSGGNPRAALWTGFQMAGVSRRKAPEDWQDRFGALPEEPWVWGQVNDILPVEGGAWIATEDGYVLHTAGGPRVRYEVLRLPGRKVYRLRADPTGNIWAATSAGLSLLSGTSLQQTALPGWSLRELGSLAADGRGWLWYAQGALVRGYQPGSGAAETLRAPAPVNCICADAAGRLWVGTSGAGLYCRAPGGGPLRRLAGIANLDGAHLLSITAAGSRLWVSGLNGVEELRLPADGSLSGITALHHGKREGIGSDYVYRIYADRQGRTWFATDGAGVTMLDAKGYHRWDSAAGFHSRVVYSITEDAFGNIWAGTLEDGLLRYDGRSWSHFGPREGLDDPTIYTVAANGSGEVAAVGARSISVWYPADSSFRHFDRRSGMGIDSFTDALNASAVSREGDVYLPFNAGLLRLRNREGSSTIRPAISLTAVSLFLKPADTAVHNFAPDQNQIGFAFVGANFAHGERLHYRYRLEGLTADWSETGDTSVTFPQLPPGSYRFTVEASLDASFAHPARASWPFTILTPLWKRWWFLGLSAAALLLLGWALFRARLRAVRKVSLLEQERLRFEYEHLRSQVNPHFLFNSLNTLTGLIEEDPAAAARYTEELSDFYRNSLALHDRDAVPLHEELRLLRHYFFIQQSRFGEALQLETSIPEGLLQSRRVVPLALQLLVENAIKHNIVSRSQPLVIAITADEDSITVSNPVRPKAGEKAKGTGLGLNNIRKRYALATDRAIKVTGTDLAFTVTLPLM